MLHRTRLLGLLALLMVVGFVEFGWVAPTHAQGTCNGARWEETNGIVVIEMESIPSLSGEWERRTSNSGRFSGYTGNGYLFFDGPSKGNAIREDGEGGLLEYKIKINTPGTYIIRWRNVVGEGDSNSEANDSWMKVVGIPTQDFYAIDNDPVSAPILYPKGSGLSPNPAGGGADGYFKVYGANKNGWTFDGRTSDFNGHSIFADFDVPGVYTVRVSGRSKGHAIDRMVLYRVNVNRNSSDTVKKQTQDQREVAENLNRGETFCIDRNNPPPEITETDPQNNETEVATDEDLELSFSETIIATGNGSISFVCQNGNTSVNIAYGVENLGNNVFAIDPNSDLPTDSTCTFSASTSVVRDLDGSPLLDNDGNNNGTYTTRFSTLSTAPEVNDTVPNDGADDVKVDSAIELTMSKLPLTASAPPPLTCDGNGQPYTVTTAQNKANTLVLTPNSDLPFDADCTFAVDVNTVTDSANNTLVDNDGDGENGTYNLRFSTEEAPQVEDTEPDDGEDDVSVNADIEIEASELLFITGQGGVTLVCDGNIVTFSVDAGNAPTYIIDPNGSLPAGVTCVFTVPVSAVADADGNDLLDNDGNNNGAFTLTFDTASDVQASAASAPVVEDAAPAAPVIESAN